MTSRVIQSQVVRLLLLGFGAQRCSLLAFLRMLIPLVLKRLSVS